MQITVFNVITQVTFIITLCLHITRQSCHLTNETVIFNDKNICIKLANSDIKLHIHQTETHYHHYWKDHYTFLFPQVKLDCECTCDYAKSYCSSETRNRENNCDGHQKSTGTCSNLEYRGQSECSLYYKACCQIFFSVPALAQEYVAYQLQLWSLTTKFYVTISHQHHNHTIQWTLPNWVENLLHQDLMFEINTDKEIDSTYDLSNRWIYYWNESENFYSDVSINEYDQFHFDKLGWFQRNRNTKIMERIPRQNIKNYLTFGLHRCNGPKPNFTWTFNAINFYNGFDMLRKLNGRTFSDIYGDQWFVSKKDFFDARPALILTTKQTSPAKIKITTDSPILFSAKTNNTNLKLTLQELPQGTYEVHVGYIEHMKMHSFVIENSTVFPTDLTLILPNNIVCKLACICNAREVNMKVCVFINDNLTFNNDDNSLETTFNRKLNTQPEYNNNEHYKQICNPISENILIPLILSMNVFMILYICILTIRKTSRNHKFSSLSTTDKKL